MTKKLQKTESKKLIPIQQKALKRWEEKSKRGNSIELAKNILFDFYKTNCDPQSRMKTIAKDVIPKIIKFEPKNNKDIENINQALVDYGIENDWSILESIEERYRGMMMNLRRELIKEYDCQTYGEKILVDMVVSAYARNLTYSKKLLNLKDPEPLSNERNNFLAVLSKEIDRANRHFITALETLRAMKQPEIKLNVKTQNAFISQNQQINNNQNKTDEIINPL